MSKAKSMEVARFLKDLQWQLSAIIFFVEDLSLDRALVIEAIDDAEVRKIWFTF